MASPFILFGLLSIRLPRRNDPDYGIAFPVAVADDQDPVAYAEHDEPILIMRMIRIVESDRTIIDKYRLRFLEGDPMLPHILTALGCIPLEAEITHMHMGHTK